MKREIWFIWLSLAVLLTTTSCTPAVPKADFDKAMSDLIAGQVQTASVQKELEYLKKELETSKKDLGDANNQVSQLKNAGQMTSDKLVSREKQIKLTKLRVQVFNIIMLPAFEGKIYTITESQKARMTLEMQDKITQIGDPELTARFGLIAQSLEKGTVSDQAAADFYVYLLKSIESNLSVEQVY
jgi:hypothetical protein